MRVANTIREGEKKKRKQYYLSFSVEGVGEMGGVERLQGVCFQARETGREAYQLKISRRVKEIIVKHT